jgi:S1-C subfamily serine protease
MNRLGAALLVATLSGSILGLLSMLSPTVQANESEKSMVARVRLTTDAGSVEECAFIGAVTDDSVNDLRRKIVRAGGDTALISFGSDNLDVVIAHVFSCASSKREAPRTASPGSSSGAPKAEPVQGTGFLVTPDGLLLTAFHIIERAEAITVRCPGRPPAPATTWKTARGNDLAIVRVAGMSGAPHLPLAGPRSLRVGDAVFTIGFPATALLGAEPKYTEGVVSALNGPHGDAAIVQVTVPVQPGSSGGALINASGEVVGIMTSTAAVQAFFEDTGALPQNVNWAAKAEYATPLFEPPVPPAGPADRTQLIDAAVKATCLVVASAPAVEPVLAPSSATPPPPPPSPVDQEMSKDDDECTRDALERVRGPRAAGPLWWSIVAESTKDQAKALYRTCMQGRGYHLPAG